MATLLSQTGDNATCFDELPVTEDLPEIIRSQCLGREILILKPVDCDDDAGEEGMRNHYIACDTINTLQWFGCLHSLVGRGRTFNSKVVDLQEFRVSTSIATGGVDSRLLAQKVTSLT